ncbi:MAG: hypothetical protein KA254_03865 [Rhodoferax sp.]|nr:hypothetical protein [Rhodoferax sp.]
MILINHHHTLIHVIEQAEQLFVMVSAAIAIANDFGNKQTRHMPDVLNDLPRMLANAKLALRRQGDQINDADTLLLRHDRDTNESARVARQQIGATAAQRLCAGLQNDLLLLGIKHLAQETGIGMQMLAGRRCVGASAGNPNPVGIDDFNLQTQQIRQHFGEAHDRRLDGLQHRSIGYRGFGHIFGNQDLSI